MRKVISRRRGSNQLQPELLLPFFFFGHLAALLFNLHRLMVCVTLLQGIVGDVQGYTPSFHVPPPHPVRVHADLFSVQHTHPFSQMLTHRCKAHSDTHTHTHLMHSRPLPFPSPASLMAAERAGCNSTPVPSSSSRLSSVSFTFSLRSACQRSYEDVSHVRMNENNIFVAEFRDAEAFDSS